MMIVCGSIKTKGKEMKMAVNFLADCKGKPTRAVIHLSTPDIETAKIMATLFEKGAESQDTGTHIREADRIVFIVQRDNIPCGVSKRHATREEEIEVLEWTRSMLIGLSRNVTNITFFTLSIFQLDQLFIR